MKPQSSQNLRAARTALVASARILGLSLALAGPSALASLTWGPAGATNNWSTATGNENWLPGPVVWTQNEDAVFNLSSGTPEAIDVTTANTFNDITFDVSGFSITSTGAGSLALANDLASTITVTNASDSASIAETIANNAGGASTLTKAGLGTLTLNGTANSTWSGGTTVSVGTLAVTSATNIALLGTGAVTVNGSASASLAYTASAGGTDWTVANNFSGSGIVALASSARGVLFSGNWSGFTGTLNVNTTSGGKLNFSGTPLDTSAIVNVANGATFYSSGKTFTNNFTAAGTGNTENRGALRLDSGCVISGNISLTADTTIGNSGGSASTISGIISGSGFGILGATTGGQPIVLSGPNTFTGKATAVGGNAFSVSVINNSGNAGNLGTNGTIDFGATGTGGTLIYTGSGETTDRVINLAGTTGGGTITQSAISGLLKFTGGVTAPGTAAVDNRKALTLNGSTAAKGEISGGIVDSTLGTAGQLATSLVKTGSGTWTLSGSNTFTGNVTISEGILGITNSSALGTGPKTITINAGANKWLELDNLGGPDIALASDLSFITSGIIGVIRNVAGNNSIAGGISMTTNNGNSKIISDGGSLLLSGAISAAAGTRILDLSGTSTGEFSGALAAANSPAIIKTGSGTWKLSGANLSAGATTCEAGTLIITGSVAGPSAATGGTLKLDYSTSDTSKLPDAAALTLGGGTLELAGGTHPEIVGSTTLTAGKNSTVSSSGSATLQMNGVTVGAGSSVTFSADGIATTDDTNVNGILPWARVLVGGLPVIAKNSTNAADGSIVAHGAYTDVDRLGGVIPNDITNILRIIESGTSGNIVMAASPVTAAGFLHVASAGGPATISFSASTDILMIGGSPGGTIWQDSTAGGLVIGTTANDGFLTSGDTSNSGSPILTFLNDSTANAITVNSAVADNGTDVVGILKSGAGHLVLAGNNSFTGAVTVNAGTLLLSGNNGFAGALTVNAGTTVTLSGNNAARPAGTSGRTVISNGGILQLQANTGNTIAGISYALSTEQTAGQPLNLNTGGLLQLRSDSSVTFAGANNFGGLGSATVTIDANALTSASGQTLTMAPAGFAVNTTTINVTGGNGYTLATGVINNVGSGATLTLNPTTANLSIAGYSANATYSTTLALGGTAGNNLVTGAIINPATSGATSLTKSGSSTWTLNGTNTFTGNVTINAGTLAIGGGSTLSGGNYAGTIANAGALVYGSSAAQTLGGIISGAGTLAVNGSGSLTLSVGNTYTGATTITSGTLVAQNNAALGTNAAGTTVSGSGTLDLGGTMTANTLDLGTEVVTISGTGAGGNGVIVNNGSNEQNKALSRIVLAGHATIGGTRRWDTRNNTPNINMGGFTLTKTGSNYIALVATTIANPGNIDVTQGEFSIQTSSNMGGTAANTITVRSGATLGTYQAAAAVPWSLVLENSATLRGENGTGAQNTFSGPVSLAAGGTGTFKADGALNVSGAISGTGSSLSKTGAGTLTLSGTNTYTGNTAISAGALTLAGAGQLKFLYGSGPATFNAISGTGTFTIDGTFNIDTTGAPTVSNTSWTLVDTTTLTETFGTTFSVPGYTESPAGTWTKVDGGGNSWVFTEADGKLTLTLPLALPFETWAAASGLDGTAGKENGKADDPDGDGRNNLEEFAFDGNPLSAANDGKVVGKIGSVGGNPALTLTLPMRAGAVFPLPEAAGPLAFTAIDGVLYTIQGSDDLSSWSLDVDEVTGGDATAIQSGMPPLSSASWTYRTFRTPDTVSADPSDFLRAMVQPAP